MVKGRTFFFVCAGIFLLAYPLASATAQAISVSYDGNTLPAADPVAPWQLLASGDGTQSVQSGVLSISDNNAIDAYIAYMRVEPDLATQSLVHFEARVGFVSNNGWFGEPAYVVFAYDPARPPDNSGQIYYPLSLYSDRIELRRHFPDGTTFVLASVSVPDLGSAYHVVGLDWYEAAQRHFEVFLDGALVAVTDGESTTPPLNAVEFGHGLYVGAGSSMWDYFRYWTDGATPNAVASWGSLKTRYRGERGVSQPEPHGR